jgi:hypothetical protein
MTVEKNSPLAREQRPAYELIENIKPSTQHHHQGAIEREAIASPTLREMKPMPQQTIRPTPAIEETWIRRRLMEASPCHRPLFYFGR